MPAEHYTLVLTFCFSLLTSSWSSDSVIYCPRNKLFIFLREQSSLLHTGKNGDKVLWSLIAGWKGSLKMSLLLLIDWQGNAAQLYSLRQSLILWKGQRCAWGQNSQNLLPWLSEPQWNSFQPPKIGILWIIYTWSVVSWRFGNMGKKIILNKWKIILEILKTHCWVLFPIKISFKILLEIIEACSSAQSSFSWRLWSKDVLPQGACLPIHLKP